MIAAKNFAFVITQGRAGDGAYDSRFTPAVDRAIKLAYPRVEKLGGRILHLPPG